MVSSSYKQSGRERKKKEFERSEEYAETGVGKKSSTGRKIYVLEYRFSPAYYQELVRKSYPSFLIDWCKDWTGYRKYETQRDRNNALARLSRDTRYEYRIKD